MFQESYNSLKSISSQPNYEGLTNQLSEDEIQTAIKQFKKRSAPGIDGITTDFLLMGSDIAVECLKSLADQIWEEERVPDDWKKQITVPIYKKDNKTDCNNFRGVAVSSVVCKVLSKAILNWTKPLLDN